MTAYTLLAYTVAGEPRYENPAYPGLSGLNCDLDDSIHLAISRDGNPAEPLHDGTGVVFAKADYTTDDPRAVTKTLIDPWLFRTADGSLACCAVQRNENAPDPASKGCVMIIRTNGSIADFGDPEALRVGVSDIRHPACWWDAGLSRYVLSWEECGTLRQGHSRELAEVDGIETAQPETLERRRAALAEAGSVAPALRPSVSPVATGVPRAIVGNMLSIETDEAVNLERRLNHVRHVSVDEPVLEVPVAVGDGEPAIAFDELPKATCRYSDGSIHAKPVAWSRDQFSAIDWSVPGKYRIDGVIRRTIYPFPFMDEMISDPYVYHIGDRYVMCCTQMHDVAFRVSDTIDDLRESPWVPVFHMDGGDYDGLANLWAQELHVVDGVPCVFTTIGLNGWSSVQCQVFRCLGDLLDPQSWEGPHPVVRPNGLPLSGDNGIGLDMTYFEVDGVHYVMWSGRDFLDKTPGREVMDPAALYIATVNPDRPWQLTSEPQLVIRPEYGWDRCESEVDEGPYLLRHGDDLFVTFSGASTALPDLYCLGLLRAKAGDNLLDPASWQCLGYPVLTKESVPGEYGPGHNMFVRDAKTGDDLMVFHAVPRDANGHSLDRRMGIRRVHWKSDGTPDLAMTPERDLNEQLRTVILTISVR
ncbi:family 43 glycosylhydrolase [Bifidobacterium simiiventris]|uniref:family 43 glycosylhydrolase n=1 Tax=Bifidobacterium simiiventris TaxID=2834434 RepID=UPI001C5822B0|nr:family 43 glycosylhydrolase [Bifidobacterium simiiventris]MBW3078479.1 family 43 glycosylhydrolase [Bifidobacterium simiiventris]